MVQKNAKILVIEDDRSVLESIISILEYSGYQAEGADRYSKKILERLQEDKIDLVILDVMLSGSDGRDLVRVIKSKEEIKKIPVLMMSAYPNMEESVKKAGADDFVKKPFDIDVLLEKVKKL